MTLYLYKTAAKTVVMCMENVRSYTADSVTAADGAVYAPLAEDCELSSKSDCSETLRAAWRAANPDNRTRIEELETENKLLKQQVSALTDQQSFYEDCIAEMAAVVYA